jgi:hypoxanthine phosphoribosyltransferase
MSGELEEHHKELMIPHWKVKRRVVNMAREYVGDQDGNGKDDLFITVLSGGATFAELFLNNLARLGYGEHSAKDNIGVSSYGRKTESNKQPIIIQNLKNPERVQGKKVKILEDIRDTGLSLDVIISHLEELGAASIEVIALLAKPEAEEVKSRVPTRIGFNIPNEFVVGEGIDWAYHYRNLLGIWKIVKLQNGITRDSRGWFAKTWEKANVWIDRLVA